MYNLVRLVMLEASRGQAVKASRLIESVLMSVPLPLVYLAKEANAIFSVIDGQQRLTSFFRFLRNDLKLTRLSVFDEFNGLYFNDLLDDMKRAFRNSSIRCIIIKRESDPDIRFEIFERLNTGSVRLNDQGLRNCIYRGKFNILLKELAEDKDWLRLIGRTVPGKSRPGQLRHPRRVGPDRSDRRRCPLGGREPQRRLARPRR